MKKTITLFSFLCVIIVQAQSLKKADKLFDEMNYIEAAETYQKYIEKRKDKDKDIETETIQNLADSYYFVDNTKRALRWYRELYKMLGSNISDKYYLRYIQSLRGVRDYEESEKHTKKYIKRKNDPKAVERYLAQKERIDSIDEAGSLYEIRNVEINSKNSDFGAAFYDTKLVYASAKDSSSADQTYSWNKQPYLNLYVAQRNGDTGALSDEQLFMPDIVSEYHDATVTFTESLDTVFYTTNIQKKRNRILLNDERTNNFQIMRGVLKDEELVNTESLAFNSEDYSTGHPALSRDGKLLFFVSDMPDGYGETDIYVVEVFPDGSMNSPKNLGKTINTEGREMFPFYRNDTLYFSSDGHYGLGGLDIFVSINKGDLEFTEPKNLAKPINSHKDDFSFIIDSTNSYGYFSSNRPQGKGDDDIYHFKKNKPKCDQYISGTVTDSITKEPIREVNIIAYDQFEDKVADTLTNNDGKYKLMLPCDKKYRLVATKPNYTTDEEEVTTGEENEEEIEGVDFELTNYDDLIEEEDNQEKISVNPIYFEFDKSDITPQAEEELNKVVFVMREFPKVKIKIEAHTDSQGADDYNLKLSQRRAESTYQYIISKGIEEDRIESAKGYGETQLKNHCANGVECTDEEHEENRRSDFIIIEK